jgi:hypothetical protein
MVRQYGAAEYYNGAASTMFGGPAASARSPGLQAGSDFTPGPPPVAPPTGQTPGGGGDDDDLPRVLRKDEEQPDPNNYKPGSPLPGSQVNPAQPAPQQTPGGSPPVGVNGGMISWGEPWSGEGDGPIVENCCDLKATMYPSTATPYGNLRAGDLLIISGNFPGSDESPSDYTPKYSDFAQMAGLQGYTLASVQPTTLAMFTKTINDALKTNGAPFNRIFLLSHAGGTVNGPSARFTPGSQPTGPSTERLNYNAGAKSLQDQTKNFPPSLAKALNGALAPSGIFVIQSCGYYNEQPNAYKERWLDNLTAMAKAAGHGVYASPGPGSPNLLKGLDTYSNGERTLGPYIGIGPDGRRLP